MKVIVGNTVSKLIIGGSDNLLKVNLNAKLRKFMKIRPSGYQHVPAYKQKRWDGYRHLINKSGQFATGFLPPLMAYAEELGASIEIEDQRERVPRQRDEIELQVGKYRMDGKYDYQARLVKSVHKTLNIQEQEIYFPRGVINAATNAGKNTVMMGITDNWTEEQQTLILIHNQTIFRQLYEEFSQLFGVGYTGQIRSGWYRPGSHITVAMYKTLLNRAKDNLNTKAWLNEIDVLMVDECHRSGGAEYSRLIQQIDAPARVFVSGTPLDNIDKVSNAVIVGMSGPTLAKITNQELIDRTVSQKPIVHLYHNPVDHRELAEYEDEEQDGILENVGRAKLIADIVAEHTDCQVLITFNEKKHGRLMYKQMLIHPGLENVRVEWVHGSDPGRIGKEKDFKDGRIDVLISSMILKEGANIPGINLLIQAQGGKSVITLKQIAGRGLRHDGKSDTIKMVDFWDDGDYLEKHSRKRIALYKKEGFEIKYHYEHSRSKPI